MCVTETGDENVFVCMRGREHDRQSTGLRQFQGFIFLIHKRQPLCAVVFFSSTSHPTFTSRQSRWHNCIRGPEI